jgi:hypothetical protein
MMVPASDSDTYSQIVNPAYKAHQYNIMGFSLSKSVSPTPPLLQESLFVYAGRGEIEAVDALTATIAGRDRIDDVDEVDSYIMHIIILVDHTSL